MNNSEISKQIKSISEIDINKEFERLKSNTNLKPNTNVGNKIVDYFTFEERLNTIGKEKINFYTFFKDISKYLEKTYIKNMIKWADKNNRYSDNLYKKYYFIFCLYFGCISIFKPIRAIEIFKQFNPKSVLDPTMGWGGRLVGACVCNIPNYIGIDMNTNLREPYKKMSDFLKTKSTTNIDLHFEDILSIDLSKFKYDMVLTSPPYYNLEVYSNNTKYKSVKEWNESFYKPFVERTYKHLDKNGFYILNISTKVFKYIKTILGEPFLKIPFVKSKKNNNYNEFFYIWNKTE
jgi:hypothetical protein